MSEHHKINYIEIPTRDIERTKAFFSQVFDWRFTDFGPDYCSIDNGSVDGGFFSSDKTVSTKTGSVLVVLYSDDLEKSAEKVQEHGGRITAPTFSFPGGSRFHFSDPVGNEFAVWTKD